MTKNVIPERSPSAPRVVHRIDELREAVAEWKRRGLRIGLVPTMGALHEGHLSLVRASRELCDVTAVTIFVNPTQFGPSEDFAQYPRTLDADVEALSSLGVDLVFAPSAADMYPSGFSTYVEPPDVAQSLEGVCRPGHFRGVTTVVMKLFQLLPADMAFFGQKDYQQYLVIRRMVEDLNVPMTIQMCPIVREEDGVAMSSRNRYLSPSERRQATAIWQGLEAAANQLKEGERAVPALIGRVRTHLDQAGITRIEYIAVTDRETLHPLQEVNQPAVALVAAYVGDTRLIDNRFLDP